MPLATRPLDLPQDEYVNWLMQNRKSIGGSSIGAICGLSSYDTQQNVWDGLVTPNRVNPDNPHTHRGRIMEPHIADMYAAATGRMLMSCSSVFHPEFWMFRATPDRIISNTAEHPDSYGILEIKSLGRETWSQSRDEGVDPSYYAQIQWYMGILGYRWGAFALHNLDAWSLHHFDVEFDRPYFEWLKESALDFWNYFVIGRRRPDGEDVRAVLPRPETPRVGATAVEIRDPAFIQACQTLRTAQETYNLAEHALELAKADVKERMGDVQLCTIPGVGRISYAESHRTTFDKDALLRDYPEIPAERYERRTATRVFRPTFNNGSTSSHRRR